MTWVINTAQYPQSNARPVPVNMHLVNRPPIDCTFLPREYGRHLLLFCDGSSLERTKDCCRRGTVYNCLPWFVACTGYPVAEQHHWLMQGHKTKTNYMCGQKRRLLLQPPGMQWVIPVITTRARANPIRQGKGQGRVCVAWIRRAVRWYQ